VQQNVQSDPWPFGPLQEEKNWPCRGLVLTTIVHIHTQVPLLEKESPLEGLASYRKIRSRGQELTS
jgi:hypothetical protein